VLLQEFLNLLPLSIDTMDDIFANMCKNELM